MASSSDEHYIFGISEIETQHDEIEAELVSLQRAVCSGESGHAICGIFGRLQDQLAVHFTLEESVMHLFSLGETARHTAAHEDLHRMIESCRQRDFIGLQTPRRLRQSVQHLAEQLHVHDKGFAAYIQRMRGLLDGDHCVGLPSQQASASVLRCSTPVDSRRLFA